MNYLAKTRKKLVSAGFGHLVYPVTEGNTLIRDTAAYLGTNDPTMVGAAVLLEQECGYERAVVQLKLMDDPL